MIHEITDGDVLLVGVAHNLTKEEAAELRDLFQNVILERLNVTVNTIIMDQSPSLFEVLRRATGG